MLASATRTFAANLSALRDFVHLVGSLLAKRQQELARQHRKDLVPLLLMLNKIEPSLAISEQRLKELESEFGGNIQVEAGENEKHEQSWTVKISDTKWDPRPVVELFLTDTKHRALLYRSSLISLVSSAEWFLSQVIRAYFDKIPGASGTEGKTLTLDELKSLGSVDDARRYLTDLRIDEIMWGSFEDWIRFLTGTVKLSADYLGPHRAELIEVFQRRNVMVHNNGIVHSSYMKRVDPEFRKGVSLGDALGVSPEYLGKAIDLVERNFVLIAAELWKRLSPTDGERAKVMNEVAFERLKAERWFVSEGLSFFTLNDKKMSEQDRLIAQLNYWQSVKWQGAFDTVREEVEGSDFSAKDDLYQLARHALLDDTSAFFKSVPILIRNQKLTYKMLTTWPIFKEMRKDGRYNQYKKKTTKSGSRRRTKTKKVASS
ncbi:MAG TPA: hypothetical protein VK302_04150 [Terriglobales bacterium]|nr:hypothetical protein [Terriglobales bacterium]